MGRALFGREPELPALLEAARGLLEGKAEEGTEVMGKAGKDLGMIAELLSPAFLRGDGGHEKIVWMTRKLREKLLAAWPGLGPIATEEEVSDLRGLEAFLRERR